MSNRCRQTKSWTSLACCVHRVHRTSPTYEQMQHPNNWATGAKRQLHWRLWAHSVNVNSYLLTVRLCSIDKWQTSRSQGSMKELQKPAVAWIAFQYTAKFLSTHSHSTLTPSSQINFHRYLEARDPERLFVNELETSTSHAKQDVAINVLCMWHELM